MDDPWINSAQPDHVDYFNEDEKLQMIKEFYALSEDGMKNHDSSYDTSGA